MKILNWINVSDLMLQSELVLRILVATILGAVIGFERKNRNKGAGMRTHAIVGLGSALMMVISKYGFMDIPDYDPGRVAAQVISGIGFLGAGIIFVRNSSISGLTTAAGIWTTAGVGLGVGGGLYGISICATILLVVVQVVLHKVYFLTKEPFQGQLKLSTSSEKDVIEMIRQRLTEEKIEIFYMKINKEKSNEIKIDVSVLYPPGFDKVEFISKVCKMEDIHKISG